MRNMGCAQPVDYLRMDCAREHVLYSLLHTPRSDSLHESPLFPQHPQKPTTILSTAFFVKINLLFTDFSTLYTGLITNITK